MDEQQQPSVQQPIAKQPKPQRGETMVLHTTAVAFEGNAVSRREDGYVVFVEGALADETVRAEIVRAKGKFAESKLLEVLEVSAVRRAPVCAYFGTCGGCSLQHMRYDAQLETKTSQVRDVFERIGTFSDPPVRDAIGSNEREFHYRNKMEFSFSESRWLSDEEIAGGDVQDRFALGLHVRGRYDRVLDNADCSIAHPLIPKLLDITRAFSKANSLRVFDPDNVPDGLLRFLVVRNSYHTDEMMVNIVTSRFDNTMMSGYAELLQKELPEITTLVNNINSRRAQVATGEREETIFGDGYITDRIGEQTYRISANSFFQTNTAQAETLYRIAEEFAELRPDDHVWDLYCGTGTISLFVATKVKHVLGIEVVDSAIADAHANATRNTIDNVDFIAGDLRKVLLDPNTISSNHRPDAMIIDPPRSGMHPDVVREVLELAPERIAYISCNPATQARDIAMMSDRYDLIALQPVDMFPQTWHIECVAKLRKK